MLSCLKELEIVFYYHSRNFQSDEFIIGCTDILLEGRIKAVPETQSWQILILNWCQVMFCQTKLLKM